MSNEPANTRLNNYIERFGVWACSIIMGFGLMTYQDLKAQTDKLEEKVNFLYQDKVSKAELREEINRIVKAQEAAKTDIIARMELYFGRVEHKP